MVTIMIMMTMTEVLSLETASVKISLVLNEKYHILNNLKGFLGIRM
jgi:hypothetical protein